MNSDPSPINRRSFLQKSAGAGLFALAAGNLSSPGAQVSRFAYDVERFKRTDPSLIQYELVTRYAAPIEMPRGIAVDAQDQVLVAGKTGVAVSDSTGARVKTLTCSGPARCVAVGADGTTYAGVQDHVEVFGSTGTPVRSWEAPGKKAWITGLAVSQEGLFAADSGNRLIWRFDREGKVGGRLAEKNPDREIPGLVVPSPYLGVKLGADGLLRVNNPGRHRVEVYTAEGDLELFWGKPTAGISGFCGCCNPISLALLPDGRSVTCEKGLPRVKVYAADGTFECVVAGPESFPKNAKAGSARNPIDGTMGGLDVAVDSRGRIHVLDLVAEEIQVFQRKA
ncbi:MAG TPA: hypothetical protein VN673_13330 [Clostridia bacterium]|nr:hypothetical protein [Clostridia bacterium]